MTAIVTVDLQEITRIPHFTWGSAYLPHSSDSELTVHIRISSQDSIDAFDDLVFLQARQGDSGERNYSDAFALQIIAVAPDMIYLRVRRVDSDEGWGQQLRICVLITRRAA